MINIFLDDLRQCPEGFILVKNVSECKKLLIENEVNILSLDHDLGLHDETGYNIALFLVEELQSFGRNYWPNEIYLHTDNPVGRQNMFQLLDRWKPEGVVIRLYSFRQ
jgi:hypothetical protein